MEWAPSRSGHAEPTLVMFRVRVSVRVGVSGVRVRARIVTLGVGSKQQKKC